MPLTPYMKNALLDVATGNRATVPEMSHVSVHNDPPGDAGANEIAGQARQSINFDAANAGNADSSNVPQFVAAADITVKYYAFWDALTGGNCCAWYQLVDGQGDPQPRAMLTGDKLNVSDVDISL